MDTSETAQRRTKITSHEGGFFIVTPLDGRIAVSRQSVEGEPTKVSIPVSDVRSVATTMLEAVGHQSCSGMLVDMAEHLRWAIGRIHPRIEGHAAAMACLAKYDEQMAGRGMPV